MHEPADSDGPNETPSVGSFRVGDDLVFYGDGEDAWLQSDCVVDAGEMQ